MYRKLLIHSCYILIICNSKCPGEAVVVLNANLRWCDGDNLFDSFSPEVREIQDWTLARSCNKVIE